MAATRVFRVRFDGGPLDGAEFFSPVEIDKVVLTTAYETSLRYETDDVNLDGVEDGGETEKLELVLRPTNDVSSFDEELRETMSRR